jgi:hypothetical protein
MREANTWDAAAGHPPSARKYPHQIRSVAKQAKFRHQTGQSQGGKHKEKIA